MLTQITNFTIFGFSPNNYLNAVNPFKRTSDSTTDASDSSQLSKLETLPKELLREIFSLLSTKDFCTLYKCSKSLKAIGDSEQFSKILESIQTYYLTHKTIFKTTLQNVRNEKTLKEFNEYLPLIIKSASEHEQNFLEESDTTPIHLPQIGTSFQIGDKNKDRIFSPTRCIKVTVVMSVVFVILGKFSKKTPTNTIFSNIMLGITGGALNTLYEMIDFYIILQQKKSYVLQKIKEEFNKNK